MQSASPKVGALALPGHAWRRTRAALPASTLWISLFAFLLILTIARSTVSASWVVIGIELSPLMAIGGAAVMGVLALTPIPSWAGLAIGLVSSPGVAVLASANAFRVLHPYDPSGLALVNVWTQRISDGSAWGDNAFVLLLITWLMWIAGAWLMWCTLRWRQPLLGLIPGAAAFATNVLNYPQEQNTYVLVFITLTLVLLLVTNYTSSVAKAARARVKIVGDATWDFWESGLVAGAVLIIAAILIPPFSTIDRTASMESSLFSQWAQLQQELNHPDSATNSGPGGTGTTGFSLNVSLGGALKKSKNTVFTYTVTGGYPGPSYFRGVNITGVQGDEWTYQPTSNGIANLRVHIDRGQQPPYSENYTHQALATFTVNMLAPPAGNSDILFYPGQVFHADRVTTATEIMVPQGDTPTTQVNTIDRLSSLSPPRSNGTYNITSEYSDVGEAALRGAGLNYPDWLLPYMSLPPNGYRTPEVLGEIHNLAVSLTQGLTNPYDEATAIQNYLRGPTFHYVLTPPLPPPGVDPLHFFLFDSKLGYCEYFATAMGDMLRSIGIPTRLVNGFGPGQFDSVQHRWVVKGEDAHTWVETYFPGYGWIPFEPTSDNVYNVIQRGLPNATNVCLRDNNCDNPVGLPGAVATPSNREIGRVGGPQTGGGAGSGPQGFHFNPLDPGTLTKILGVLFALVLLCAAGASRYLRPGTVMGVWKRTQLLVRLAGAEILPGETPMELGRRMARLFPEAAIPVRQLAGGFMVAAYAPQDEAEASRGNVMEAWATLRPLMLKRVAGRLRLVRA